MPPHTRTHTHGAATASPNNNKPRKQKKKKEQAPSHIPTLPTTSPTALAVPSASSKNGMWLLPTNSTVSTIPAPSKNFRCDARWKVWSSVQRR